MSFYGVFVPGFTGRNFVREDCEGWEIYVCTVSVSEEDLSGSEGEIGRGGEGPGRDFFSDGDCFRDLRG